MPKNDLESAGAPSRSARVPFWLQLQKRLLRRLISHAHRHQARALYNLATWRFYTGDNVRCNCCDGRFRRFRTYSTEDGHRSLMCPRCGSLGRHRVDWLYLIEHTDVLNRPTRLLHIAPEVCLATPIRRLSTVQYLSADYDSTLAMDHVDVTDIHYRDESFDGIICNHVLNFVDDDRPAMNELCRITKTGGWALLQSCVDMSRANTIENHKPTTADDVRYEEVFMRSYGRDYATRLEQAGFAVTEANFVSSVPVAVQRELGLDPGETIFFCKKPAGG